MKKLRLAQHRTLEEINKKNLLAFVGVQDTVPPSGKVLWLFPQQQTAKGVVNFLKRRAVDDVLQALSEDTEWEPREIHPVNEELFADDGNRLVIQIIFGSKNKAKAARTRFIEEHHGGAWPPFGVVFAPTRLPDEGAARAPTGSAP